MSYEEEPLWVNYEKEVDQLKNRIIYEFQKQIAADLMFEFEKCHQDKRISHQNKKQLLNISLSSFVLNYTTKFIESNVVRFNVKVYCMFLHDICVCYHEECMVIV